MAVEMIRRWVGYSKDMLPLAEGVVPKEVDMLVSNLHTRYKSFLVDPKPTIDSSHYTRDWALRDEMAELGRTVGTRVDALSEFERKAYIARFCQETGFPNTADTSRRILSHVTSAIAGVASSLDLTIAYAGYANTCSVGKGLALPGSDMDFITIAVRDENDDFSEFHRHLTKTLNPRLTDIDMGWGIFTMSRVRGFMDYLRTHGKRVNYRELSGMGWSDGHVCYASSLVTNVRTGADIINKLSDNERRGFGEIEEETTEINRLQDAFFDQRKHGARRRLLEEFPSFTTDEQFVVIRIMQIDTESLALDISDDGPHSRTLTLLQEKGILTKEGNNLKSPWATYPWLFRNKWFWFYPNRDGK